MKMPSIINNNTNDSLQALTSTKVVLGDQVVPATIVFSATSGIIVKIIRQDTSQQVLKHAVVRSRNENSSSSDEEEEYYTQELESLGVSPENHRNLGDFVLMPGLVDAHVHLNEVSQRERRKKKQVLCFTCHQHLPFHKRKTVWTITSFMAAVHATFFDFYKSAIC